ncbi:MAG: cardiolipin synthase [Phycisphaeraceae bacterium]|nr:cardiolipin synthase [Phycisphaeraceae bacterium]
MDFRFLLTFTTLEWITRLVMVLVILRRRIDPSVALAWLMIVFFQPFIGLVVYLLVGERRLGRKRRRIYRQVRLSARSEKRAAAQYQYVTRPEVSQEAMPIILQAERYGGFPILGGNRVDLITETDVMIDRLINDIRKAKHHVHLLFYIYGNDGTGKRVADALIEARRRGVACRVIADHQGSRPFFRWSGIAGRLRRHGVDVVRAQPVNLIRRNLGRIDLRNHRKLAVIDGLIGYAGSQNVVDPDYGHRRVGPWHDVMARFEGPVVGDLQTVFVEDWGYETSEELNGDEVFPELTSRGVMAAQVIATGPGSNTVADRGEVLPRLFMSAVNTAQRRIIITTPYLIMDDTTLLSLALAVDRGVRVDIVVPRKADQWLVHTAGQFYYQGLLEAGINLYLHQTGLLHSKTITVDDNFCLVGSTNLDRRSFYLNFELTVAMYGHEITRQMRFMQTGYINESVPLQIEQWRQRPIARKYAQAAAALFSPLL